MKILALDSSGLVASAAIVEDDCLISEYSVQYKKTHSQTLLPMIDEVCRMTELDLGSLDAIAVAEGPGSFTGLRIGAATAKALSFALDIPLVGVPTLEALAHNLYGTDRLICPLMDARRNQVYTGVYEYVRVENSLALTALLPSRAMGIEEIADALNRLGRPLIFCGDGVPVYEALLHELVKAPYSFAPAHVNRQRAAAVAALAIDRLKAGEEGNADTFVPKYIRLSQAEREKARETEKKCEVSRSIATMAPLEEESEEKSQRCEAETPAGKAAQREENDTSVIIRPMEERDIEAISEIEARVFSMPWSAEDFRQMIKGEQTCYYVAETNGKPIGAIGAWNIAGDCQITNLLVDVPYRRKGVARKLFTHLLNEQNATAEIYSLEVRESNQAAINLYASLGFQSVQRRPDFYEQPVEDALVFTYMQTRETM